MSPWLFNGWSDEGGEYGDGKEGRELHGGWERVEIAWSLVCRWLGSMGLARGRPEGDGGVVC